MDAVLFHHCIINNKIFISIINAMDTEIDMKYILKKKDTKQYYLQLF